jgi:hypothetical protein
VQVIKHAGRRKMTTTTDVDFLIRSSDSIWRIQVAQLRRLSGSRSLTPAQRFRLVGCGQRSQLPTMIFGGWEGPACNLYVIHDRRRGTADRPGRRPTRALPNGRDDGGVWAPRSLSELKDSDEALLRFFVQERIISTNYAKKQVSGWMGPGA